MYRKAIICGNCQLCWDYVVYREAIIS